MPESGCSGLPLEIPDRGARNRGHPFNGTNSTINVDAQVSYTVNDHLKLSVEGINLTDERNDQVVDETNRLNVLTHSGRQLNFGAKFTF